MRTLPFGGLNLYQITDLIFYPLEKNCVLQLAKTLDSEAVKDIHFIKFCKVLLQDIKAQQPMKLTTKGNFPRKFVHQMYNHRIYPSSWIDEGRVKLLKEADFGVLHHAHILLKMAGIIKKYSNKISLTQKGEKIMEDSGKLYLEIIKAYVQKFNWSYMSYLEDKIAQYGWAFIMYVNQE